MTSLSVYLCSTQRPKKSPYRDRHGIVIVETRDLPVFFEEFVAAHAAQKENEGKARAKISTLARKLSSAEPSRIARFIDEPAYRKKVLELVAEHSIYLVADFIPFLEKCIAETWKRSAPNGAFEGYDQNLNLILDTLTAFDFKVFPPALFQTAAESLQRVAHYVGGSAGQSYAANKTWEDRKGELSAEIVSELSIVARQYGYGQVRDLLKSARK